MEFHPSKRHVISIINKVKPIIGTYQIYDHILEQVHGAKYFGVHIDSKLTFNTQVIAVGIHDASIFHVSGIGQLQANPTVAVEGYPLGIPPERR